MSPQWNRCFAVSALEPCPRRSQSDFWVTVAPKSQLSFNPGCFPPLGILAAAPSSAGSPEPSPWHKNSNLLSLLTSLKFFPALKLCWPGVYILYGVFLILLFFLFFHPHPAVCVSCQCHLVGCHLISPFHFFSCGNSSLCPAVSSRDDLLADFCPRFWHLRCMRAGSQNVAKKYRTLCL